MDVYTKQVIGEFLGTATMMFMGTAVSAGASLNKSKSQGMGWFAISFAWGLAVAMGAWVAGGLWGAPAHLNPAITVAMAIADLFPWNHVLLFAVAQMAGGFLGAALAWLHFYPHWRETEDPNLILGSFASIPAIRLPWSNVLSEIFATFMLVYLSVSIGARELSPGLSPIVVSTLIMAIALGLGATTGYAMNPARDLGPRLVHQLFPVANKGTSDWGYAWVPVVGPMVGGSLGALAFLIST